MGPLQPSTALVTAITGGVTMGHNAVHTALDGFYDRGDILPFYNVKHYGATGDGTTNDTVGIGAAITDCPFGGVLYFPKGAYVTDPITITKSIHILGDGKFSSRLVPRTNSSSPLLTIDTTVDSGEGVYNNYGASLSRIGINRIGHMAGPCLHVSANTQLFEGESIFMSGGTRSIELRGGNPTLHDARLWDASDCMIHMVDGLEAHFSMVRMAAQVQPVDAYWKVILASGGGARGAIYIHPGCTGNALATVNKGMVVTAPSLTELPIFSDGLILDNVVGGGPVLTLTNIQSARFDGGWMNGSNGCVLMDGCVFPSFGGNRYRGGTHTYEFGSGAVTGGFQSIGNEIPTGPAYKVGASNKPTVIHTDDYINATDIGQVTNDPTWFENASRRTWGSRRFQSMLRHREAGTTPPNGYVVLASGLATVTHPSVTTNTRVRVWHERPGSSPGIIYSSVTDNVIGTSFKIRSTSGADNAGVYWEMVGDAD